MDKLFSLFDIVMITVSDEEKARGEVARAQKDELRSWCEQIEATPEAVNSTGLDVQIAEITGDVEIVVHCENGADRTFSFGGVW